MRIIDLSDYENDVSILERAHYEYICRQNIIQFMISNNMNNNSNYSTYWEEYLMYYKAYNKIKHEFFKNIISPLVGNTTISYNWEVDFFNREVKIYD